MAEGSRRFPPLARKRGSRTQTYHACALPMPCAGGKAYSPSSLGMGANPGHHEHRRPSTRVPTEARGWRSRVRRSIARLVPHPGQKTSSQGVPASNAARIVGDQSMSRPVANLRFQLSTTASASACAALSALNFAAPVLMSGPRVRTPISGITDRCRCRPPAGRHHV
jgi:hypothetical protein